jgi:hypothetical protein
VYPVYPTVLLGQTVPGTDYIRLVPWLLHFDQDFFPFTVLRFHGRHEVYPENGIADVVRLLPVFFALFAFFSPFAFFGNSLICKLLRANVHGNDVLAQQCAEEKFHNAFVFPSAF